MVITCYLSGHFASGGMTHGGRFEYNLRKDTVTDHGVLSLTMHGGTFKYILQQHSVVFPGVLLLNYNTWR